MKGLRFRAGGGFRASNRLPGGGGRGREFQFGGFGFRVSGMGVVFGCKEGVRRARL